MSPPLPSSSQKKKPKGKRASDIEEQVRETLLQLMCESESDSVRVAAAKALMDKLLQGEQEVDEARKNEEDERAAAISEARALLAELAEAKSGGVREPHPVDTNGKA